MSFTVKDFSDLVTIINTQPEWRQQLVKVLFPNIDLAQSLCELQQALKELAQAQARTEQSLNLLTKRVDEAAKDRQRIETKFDAKLDEAAEDRRRIEARLDKGFNVVNLNIANLKGVSYEWTISYKAASIFGSLIRRGKNIRDKISEQLYEALESGKISYNELEQVMATDVLWSGVAYPSGVNVVLVIEVSWRAESNDIERAVTRASILRTIDIKALPIVAGKEWDNKIVDLALERGVVIVEDKRANKDSWQSALSGN